MTQSPHKLFGRVPRLASVAEQILALVGLAAIVIAAGRYVYRAITFADVAGYVRPVCELYLFRDTPGLVEAGAGELRLLGMQLIATQTISGVRGRFPSVRQAHRWEVSSDALSSGEIEALRASLPTGRVGGDLVTPQLPPLAPESVTRLFLIAEVGSDVCVDDQFPEAFGASGRLLHADPSQLTLRGLSFMLPPLAWLLIFVVVGTIAVALRYALNRKHPR